MQDLHISQIHYILNLMLKLDDLFNHECAKLIYLSNYGRLPPYLNQQLNFKKVSSVLRNSTRRAKAIQISRFSTAKCQRSFTYVGTKIWNNIPQELKDFPYSKFKATYKKAINSKVCLIIQLVT